MIDEKELASMYRYATINRLVDMMRLVDEVRRLRAIVREAGEVANVAIEGNEDDAGEALERVIEITGVRT